MDIGTNTYLKNLPKDLVGWLSGVYGEIVLGVAWVVVSYTLWLEREEALQQAKQRS